MKSPRSTILSPERARTLGQGLALASALVVVTCAGAATGPVVPPGAPAPPVRPESSSPAAPASSEGPAAPPASTAPPPEATLPLPRLRAALEALAAGKRSESVRILWLGDSHAAADFWPDAVRRPLAQKYGSGGPGFLFVGLSVYRHAGVKVDRDGHFRTEPKQPSLWMRQADGVFGLGGIRVVPDGESCKITVELGKDALRGESEWDLSYRLPTAEARFRVQLGDEKSLAVDAKTGPVGAIGHVAFRLPPGRTVVIDRAAGEPQLFGLTVEDVHPGVVVDTLGINGARIGTPLAWDEAQWVSEAARRDASLFVLAYGTNEAGDQAAVRRYGPELTSLVERARKALPNADCLVVGPTDREGPGWITLPRVPEIDQELKATARSLGCEYFSAFATMGGEGSLKHWADQSPPLAAPDRVHLTPRGYAELGAKMAALLDGAP